AEAVERGLELGAVDYVVKPFAVEVFLAKIRRHLDAHAAAGAGGKVIRGSLDEMPLPDILRILCEAGRSGRITVRGKRHEGEVYLSGGQPSHATFGKAIGEEAFAAVMGIRAGQFTFEPEITSDEATLQGEMDDLMGRAKKRLAGA
ncbi:MAG: DUF4388 domain-containing protein, partial [Verrucomicrobiota bacterium]